MPAQIIEQPVTDNTQIETCHVKVAYVQTVTSKSVRARHYQELTKGLLAEHNHAVEFPIVGYLLAI